MCTLWTGIPDYLADFNGDGSLETWQRVFYGQTGLNPNTIDAQGNTLLADYQNAIANDLILFSLTATNDYVGTTSSAVQMTLLMGKPGNIAISVDDPNYATDTVWHSYTGTNAGVTLPSTQGWHQVWIGLKGPASDAPITWQGQRLKLDTIPPVLVITNPVGNTVTVPVLQLQGYCPEPLSSLSYDLTNSQVGIVTNQMVLVTGEFYDPATAEFTTNYFQAYDVPLTNGLNQITLHAIDMAGNAVSLTTTITCAAYNPPTVNLLWPQDGMPICGSSFTLQGQVDDPSATVSLAATDANGNPVQLNGLTGRDGTFYVENVPLNPGSNPLTLTVNNLNGVSTTTLSVTQSTVGLTINPVQAGDTTVSGTMDTAGYTIWANGAQATQDGNGNWTATITPIGLGGGVVNVSAVPNTSGGYGENGQATGLHAMQDSSSSSDTPNAQATVQPPQGVIISRFYSDESWGYWLHGDAEGWPNPQYTYDIINWTNCLGGSETNTYYEDWLPYDPGPMSPSGRPPFGRRHCLLAPTPIIYGQWT